MEIDGPETEFRKNLLSGVSPSLAPGLRDLDLGKFPEPELGDGDQELRGKPTNPINSVSRFYLTAWRLVFAY